jgi:Flp pilus assembly protein TadG
MQDGGRRNRGAAAVELAVVAPVLLTLVFGIIEFGWTMMVRQTMINAAREGCRAATLKYTSVTALEAAVVSKIDGALSSLGFSYQDGDYTLSMVHASDPPVAPNTTETVTIAVPYAQVSLLGDYFCLPEFDIQARAVMRKEF